MTISGGFTPGTKDLPVAGDRRERAEAGAFCATLAETQEPEEFEPKEFIAQGDTVVGLGHYRWRVKSTWRRFESVFAHVFTVKNGKSVNFHEYFDTHAGVLAYKQRSGVGWIATTRESRLLNHRFLLACPIPYGYGNVHGALPFPSIARHHAESSDSHTERCGNQRREAGSSCPEIASPAKRNQQHSKHNRRGRHVITRSAR